MAYLHKDEATKAFEIAIENLGSGKYEEALKSANEAKLMNPELPHVKRLVTLLQVLSARPDTTHYEILGIEETANENEIRLAYRKLAVDLNQVTNIFPKASEAYRRVSEATRDLFHDRSKYDNDLAAAREGHAIVAEIKAMQGFAFDFGTRARVSEFVTLYREDFFADHEVLAQAAPKHEASIGKYLASSEREARLKASTFDGMVPFNELQAPFGALHDKDFLVGGEIYPRVVPEFETMFGKDVFGTLGYPASFGVLDAFDGKISPSELQAAFEAYDKDPQSTTDNPAPKRCVRSSDEVPGRGTKSTNTTQATLTNPVQKKKMDGHGPFVLK